MRYAEMHEELPVAAYSPPIEPEIRRLQSRVACLTNTPVGPPIRVLLSMPAHQKASNDTSSKWCCWGSIVSASGFTMLKCAAAKSSAPSMKPPCCPYIFISVLASGS